MKTARREPLGRATKAFTLIELLAVVGIMLLLITGVFGVFGLLAQEAGPEAAVSTLQAMLNSARDYAVSNGVDTRVVFSVDNSKGVDGTTMALQCLKTDGTWDYVRGRKPFAFHGRIYICKGMPRLVAGTDYVDPGSPLNNTMNAAQKELAIKAWNKYRQDLLTAVNKWTLQTDGTLKSDHRLFWVNIGPTGYMKTDIDASATVDGFTVIQVGGTRVIGYVFYPLNPNTGTRLLFE